MWNVVFEWGRNADEMDSDNRRSGMPMDGRSELSIPSANSRRPTIDSNISARGREVVRELSSLLAPSSRGIFSHISHSMIIISIKLNRTSQKLRSWSNLCISMWVLELMNFLASDRICMRNCQVKRRPWGRHCADRVKPDRVATATGDAGVRGVANGPSDRKVESWKG